MSISERIEPLFHEFVSSPYKSLLRQLFKLEDTKGGTTYYLASLAQFYQSVLNDIWWAGQVLKGLIITQGEGLTKSELAKLNEISKIIDLIVDKRKSRDQDEKWNDIVDAHFLIVLCLCNYNVFKKDDRKNLQCICTCLNEDMFQKHLSQISENTLKKTGLNLSEINSHLEIKFK